MLEQYFLRPTTVDRIRSNWLAPQIEQYVEWMHAQKYAGRNITRRVAILCHFADFARANGATDLASATSLVEKYGDHWMGGSKCWNLKTRPKLCRDICSIIRQMLRLILEGSVTANFGVIGGNPGNVTVINGATNSTATLTDPKAVNPGAVAVNSTTNKVYVANYVSNNVTVIDGAR